MRVDAVPERWTRLVNTAEDAFVPELQHGQVHWLINTKDEPTCRSWTLDAKLEGKAYRGRLRSRQSSPGRVVLWSYGVEYVPSQPGRLGGILLLGPNTITYSEGRREDGGYRCAFELTFAQRRGDVLEFLSSGDSGIVAYEPEDAQRWYVTSEACEGARREAMRALSQDARVATRLGFAHGC